jgi:DNA-binding XRE family transcriptional regulator
VTRVHKHALAITAVAKARSMAKPKAKSGKSRNATDRLPGKAGTPYPVGSFLDTGGRVVIERVVKDFGMSKGQLAETVGLNREALYKTERIHAPKTQTRMREMLEIVSRISKWAGGKDQAMAWYRAEPIPAFGDRTAESLVKTGQAGVVRDYLDHIATGGFA